MKIELCDKCGKEAIGRIKVMLREIGSSKILLCKNIPNTAYCKKCAEKDFKEIIDKFKKQDDLITNN